MVQNKYKSDAVAQLLQQEASIHYFNPTTKKIDLKMFLKYLHKKDENIDAILSTFEFDNSSMSDNHVLCNLMHFSSNADIESTSVDESATIPSAKKSEKFD